jgi:ribosome-associated protein
MTAARQFAIDAARLASLTHCHNVTVMEVASISPVADYFIVATGTSPRQMRTVCDEVAELGEPRGYKPYHQAGYEGDAWVLTDFIDVVFHIFSQEARLYYDLDSLWGDAPRVAWQEAPAAQAAGKSGH